MKLNLNIPPAAEQERIVRELDALNQQIDEAKCLNVKDALMLELRDKMAFYFGQSMWAEQNKEENNDEK